MRLVAALVVVPRLLSRLVKGRDPGPWEAGPFRETTLRVPEECSGRRWRNVFTGEALSVQGGSTLAAGDACIPTTVANCCNANTGRTCSSAPSIC